jgi:hypothetical protein
MRRTTIAALVLNAALCVAPAARAATDDELAQIRKQIEELKTNYERRIQALEERLKQAESASKQAKEAAGKAETAAQSAESAAAQANTRPAAANTFNPAISLILQGQYGWVHPDPDTYKIQGFIPPSSDLAVGARGFNLGESELVITAGVDPYFTGRLVASLAPDNSADVEEAFAQTTRLPYGLTLRAGRWRSAIGYQNEQHPHAWDFVDAPLPYQAFFGGSYLAQGIQARWVAPTDLYIELGFEGGQGLTFPGTANNTSGFTATSYFAKFGGDIGASYAWLAGISQVRASPKDRTFDDIDSAGGLVTNSFSGNSTTTIADFVLKWAPDGNPTERNFKFQTEYFWRNEGGTATFDQYGTSNVVPGPLSAPYSSHQSGWYAQAVYQFIPRWRAGVRYDRLDSGTVTNQLASGLGLTAADFPVLVPYNPSRLAAMVDFSPTEFSRIRFQAMKDYLAEGITGYQYWLQYIMSIGPHGAHQF